MIDGFPVPPPDTHDDYDIEHIFTFDTDDFHTLGFVVVPADTGDS